MLRTCSNENFELAEVFYALSGRAIESGEIAPELAGPETRRQGTSNDREQRPSSSAAYKHDE